MTLYLLTKFEQNKPNQRPLLYFVIPLVTFLWANTHGSVILGLIILFSFVISYFIRMAIAYQIRHGISPNFRTLVPFLISPLLATIVTLANPFGFRIYEEMWRHFAGPIDLSQLIAEWVPPQSQIQQIILISGAAVAVYLIFTTFRSRKVYFALPTLLLIPIFTFWALRARRNVPFFFAVASFSLPNALPAKEESPIKKQLAGLLATGALLYGLLVQLPQTIATNSSWENFCQNKSLALPCEAVEFLKTQPAGNIFNRYEWGGFLTWQLPEYKIFVDGRMPSWLAPRSFSEGGPASGVVSPYTIYLETLQTRPGWQETLSEYNITYILISPGTFMDLLLKPNPTSFGWQEVLRNKISVVYKKL